MPTRIKIDYQGHQNLPEMLDTSIYAGQKHASLWVFTPLIKADVPANNLTLVAENLDQTVPIDRGFVASTQHAALVRVRRHENPIASQTEVRLYGNGTLTWLDRRLNTLTLPKDAERRFLLGKVRDRFDYVAGYIFRGDQAAQYIEELIANKSPQTPRMRHDPIFT